MRRALTLILSLWMLVGAAGCGSSASGSDVKRSNAYADAVNRAQKDFAGQLDTLSEKVTPTSTRAQDDATLRAFRSAVDRVVGRLRALDVPERVRPLHARFVRQIAAYGAEIDRVRPGFGSTDPRKVLAAQTQLRTAVDTVSRRINATIDQINGRLRG